MQPKQLQLELTLEEVNTILTALGQQPYVQVYELIGKIRQQAGAQVQSDKKQQTGVEHTSGDE